jgi:hypothetical protein
MRTLSQEWLARNLGVARGNLAGLERGLHTPTFYTIIAAAGVRRHFCRVLPDVRTFHPRDLFSGVFQA